MSQKLETVTGNNVTVTSIFYIEMIEQQHSLKTDVHFKKWYSSRFPPQKTSLRGLFSTEKSEDGGRSLRWLLKIKLAFSLESRGKKKNTKMAIRTKIRGKEAHGCQLWETTHPKLQWLLRTNFPTPGVHQHKHWCNKMRRTQQSLLLRAPLSCSLRLVFHHVQFWVHPHALERFHQINSVSTRRPHKVTGKTWVQRYVSFTLAALRRKVYQYFSRNEAVSSTVQLIKSTHWLVFRNKWSKGKDAPICLHDRGSPPSTTELLRRNELYQMRTCHAEPETETNLSGTALAE